MIRLAAFLGNVGAAYAKNRHNAAWQFAASLPFYSELDWRQKFKGECASLSFEEFARKAERHFPQLLNKEGNLALPKNPPEKIYFLKPWTLMNLSGESIATLSQFFKIEPREILICHDELELPAGTFGLKWAGGLAGHNGLRSAKERLGTADFWRLRFGISKPAGANIADHVLSDFTGDETITMSLAFERAAELFCRAVLAGEPERLLPQWAKVKV